MNAFRLDGQVAAVTGACGKLGPIWVEALVDAGARVAALDLAGATASAAFERLSSRAGSSLRRFDCDITNRAAIEAAAQTIVAELGPPSVLVNNAGIDQPPDPASVGEETFEAFKRALDVNLAGVFNATTVFGSAMLGLLFGEL